MVSLVLTVVVAAITLIVGLVILGNVETTIGSNMLVGINGNTTNVSAGAVVGDCGVDWCKVAFGGAGHMSSAFTTTLVNTGTATNFLALGLFVLAAVFIIGIVAGVMGGNQ